MSNCFKLFTCCPLVKGFYQDIIIDLQRDKLFCIPNTVAPIMFLLKTTSLTKILSNLSNKDCDIVNEYIDFMTDNELGFFLKKSESALYPDLDLSWDFPANITNMVLEIIPKFDYLTEEFMHQIENLGCTSITLIFYNDFSFAEIENLIIRFKWTSIQAINIYTNHNKTFKAKSVANLINQNLRISGFYIYSTNLKFKKYKTISKVICSRKNLVRDLCGQIGNEYFINNLLFFTESQFHNTCLNRKICIDSDGYIKNCPSMKHHYGHISDTTLAEAIEKPGFKDCWYIKKDDIDVCQDCEFRHICTDCRAFIKDPENLYSQPAKCGYNPYIAKWQHEEGWISVEQWREENPSWEEQATELRELNKKYVGANE